MESIKTITTTSARPPALTSSALHQHDMETGNTNPLKNPKPHTNHEEIDDNETTSTLRQELSHMEEERQHHAMAWRDGLREVRKHLQIDLDVPRDVEGREEEEGTPTPVSNLSSPRSDWDVAQFEQDMAH